MAFNSGFKGLGAGFIYLKREKCIQVYQASDKVTLRSKVSLKMRFCGNKISKVLNIPSNN